MGEIIALVHSEHDSIESFFNQVLSAEERAHVGILSFNQWPFALAGVVEIALGARDAGSAVSIGLWADKTPVRDSGWSTSHAVAKLLRTSPIDLQVRTAMLSSGFSPSDFVPPPLSGWQPRDLPPVKRRITRSEVRALTYHGAGMGRAILQVHPDSRTPFREDYVWPRRWVRVASKSFAWVYDQTRALIERNEITTLVVFNGRFLHDQAAAAAAQSLGVRVLYGETGGIETDFDVTTVSTHEMEHVQSRMLDIYSHWPDSHGEDRSKQEIGREWFLNRQSHSDPEVQLFVGGQEFGDLGEVSRIPAEQELVVFFSSSGDEIAELELDWHKFFVSQDNALAELASVCRDRPNTTLVVRTHPHLRIKPADDLAVWTMAIERAGVAVHVGPESTVDSYALMKRADVVVTYGSTSGVEAAFLDRPSILMGPSAYNSLGCAVPVSTREELSKALDNKVIANSELTYPYGLFLHRRGLYFHYLAGTTETELSLNGIVISDASEWARKISHVMHNRLTRWYTIK